MREYTRSYLRQLEAEAIYIIREVAACFQRPLLLYSIGKDSSVVLRLAQKAFAPAPIPFPLLHIDTTFKFQEMIRFRDDQAAALGLDLIVHTNQDGIEKGVNPFDHGSGAYTDIMKTQALRQALNDYECDAAIGGARRDEDPTRAKERIFSFRDSDHQWDPRSQRPELWNLYNTTVRDGESIRAFPLSNWTEMDVWHYIALEEIPIVPLYFAQERPVIQVDDQLIIVDDDRLPLDGKEPELRSVRCRTLGCYPLTGAVESTASTLDEVIAELFDDATSERRGRLIDTDDIGSMEKKKRLGYF